MIARGLVVAVLAAGCSSGDVERVDEPEASVDAEVAEVATVADSEAVDSSVPDTVMTPDVAPETPAPGCAAKLCDDFEGEANGAAPNPAVWTKAIASSGTIEVTTAFAHKGTKSLHIKAPTGSYETYVKETVTFPHAKNTVWGRVWFRFDATMPTDFVHWNLIEARGAGSNNRVRYGGINNPHGGAFFTNAWLFNVETMGKGEKAIDDNATPQVDPKKWYCVEWMFAGEPGKNESRLFWDGVERPKMNATNAWFETLYTMPTFNALYLGWAIYQPIARPYEVWIDDVAIGDARIGCD